MKILKNNLTEPIKCTCKDCGSIFEFDYRDIRRREVTSLALLGDVISKRFVVCPIRAYENEYVYNKIYQAKLNKELNQALDALKNYSSEKENKDEQ